MTALLGPVEVDPRTPVGWLASPRVLRGIGSRDLVLFTEHLAEHGAMPRLGLSQLLGLLDTVDLRGRGGAGFPLASKLRSLRHGARPVVVVNGCEGEPASSKDSVLLTRTPHLVLDGAALIASATGAERITLAVTSGFVAAILRCALGSRPDAALFEVRLVPHRFISGEARALTAALDGGPGVPPGRRILATDRGVGGKPTVLSNAETYAQVAILARLGASEFGSVGTVDEPGTTLLTISGAIEGPGVIEVPYGATLGEVASSCRAAAAQAVVVGGYHGSWLTPDWSMPISRAGLRAAGGTLGAGAVVFVGQDTCGLAELARIMGWLADQSARNCGPCTFGLPALASDVRAVSAGERDRGAAGRHARLVAGRGACAHPDGASGFATSGLATLAEDVRTHARYGGCGRTDQRNLRS